MEWSKEDYLEWKTNPQTKKFLKYLEDFSQRLAQNHNDLFVMGNRCSEEDFYRDSERAKTLDDIINLDIEDIEGFYDATSMG